MLRHIFGANVERCLTEDLVSDEESAVDASLIPADARKARCIATKDWNEDVARAAGNRAASEYLETLDGAACGLRCCFRGKYEVHREVRSRILVDERRRKPPIFRLDQELRDHRSLPHGDPGRL